MIVYCLCGTVCILLNGYIYEWELPYFQINNALILHRCDLKDGH